MLSINNSKTQKMKIVIAFLSSSIHEMVYYH